MFDFNDDGPVYGPNGEWELDPENDQCLLTRPVFATCKNNCPGGELSVISSELFSNNYKSADKPNVLFSVNFPVVAGEAL